MPEIGSGIEKMSIIWNKGQFKKKGKSSEMNSQQIYSSRLSRTLKFRISFAIMAAPNYPKIRRYSWKGEVGTTTTTNETTISQTLLMSLFISNATNGFFPLFCAHILNKNLKFFPSFLSNFLLNLSLSLNMSYFLFFLF